MKPTTLLGLGSALMKSKKAKIVFVALQLGYLAYAYVRDKSEEKNEKIAE